MLLPSHTHAGAAALVSGIASAPCASPAGEHLAAIVREPCGRRTPTRTYTLAQGRIGVAVGHKLLRSAWYGARSARYAQNRHYLE